MKLKMHIFVCFTAAFLFACQPNSIDSTQEVITTQEQLITNSENSNRGISNAPEQSGIYVIRTELEFFFWIFDYEQGLSLIAGIDVPALCNGDPNSFSIQPLQLVDLPSSSLGAVGLIQGNTQAYVFQNIDDDPSICDYFTNNPILAQGTVEFIYTDNDFFGSQSNRRNAFGVIFHGQLYNQNNELKTLNAKLKIIWDPDEDISEALFIDSILLN